MVFCGSNLYKGGVMIKSLFFSSSESPKDTQERTSQVPFLLEFVTDKDSDVADEGKITRVLPR